MGTERHDLRPRVAAGVWFAVLAPPAAWAVQFNVAYLLVTLECTGGLPGFRIWLFVLSAVAFAVTVAAGLAGLAARWEAPREADASGEARGRGHGLATLGVIESIVFAFSIVLAGASPFVVPAC